VGFPLIGPNDRLGQGAPQRFVAMPSEHGFHARIPIRDRPVLIHADNGVGCRLQHRPDARLALLQLRVRLMDGGKVRYGADQPQSLAPNVPHDVAAVQHLGVSSVRSAKPVALSMKAGVHDFVTAKSTSDGSS
jgi:hypothetical protein